MRLSSPGVVGECVAYAGEEGVGVRRDLAAGGDALLEPAGERLEEGERVLRPLPRGGGAAAAASGRGSAAAAAAGAEGFDAAISTSSGGFGSSS